MAEYAQKIRSQLMLLHDPGQNQGIPRQLLDSPRPPDHLWSKKQEVKKRRAQKIRGIQPLWARIARAAGALVRCGVRLV